MPSKPSELCLFIPSPPTTPYLFTTSVVLPFPGILRGGTRSYRSLSDWPLSLSTVPVGLLHVFSWLGCSCPSSPQWHPIASLPPRTRQPSEGVPWSPWAPFKTWISFDPCVFSWLSDSMVCTALSSRWLILPFACSHLPLNLFVNVSFPFVCVFLASELLFGFF